MDVSLALAKVLIHCVLFHLGAEWRVDEHAGLLWVRF